MRLLIIGSLGGQIGEASQIAASRGALVSQACLLYTSPSPPDRQKCPIPASA